MEASHSRRDSILLIYDCLYPESLGGVERRNLDLARSIAAFGNRVALAAPVTEPEQIPSGVTVIPLPDRGGLYSKGGKRRVSTGLRYSRSIADLDISPFDVIETANVPFLHLPALQRRCRRAGKFLVVSWYECWRGYWRKYLGPIRGLAAAAIERWTARRCGDLQIASSYLTERRLRQLTRRPISRLPVGIPVASIRAASLSGQPSAEPLLYAGRLIPEKRIDLLLRAIALLRTAEPVKLLRIVGEGPAESSLRALARDLGLETRVTWSGRLSGESAVWEALGACEIAIQPSFREGFGIFPAEALAAGRPVICVDSPESAAVELIEDGKNGYVVAANPEALSDAIARLLSNRALRAELGEGSRRSALQFDSQEVARQFLALIANPGTKIKTAGRTGSICP